MKHKFVESFKDGLEKRGNAFTVRLITAGQGSSGYYEADMLAQYLPTALPKGTKVYFDHTSEAELETGRARSMENLVGVFESDPVVEDGEGRATVRFYENSPRFNNVPAFIEEAINDIGVSIEIHAGRIGEDGVVEALDYSPHNSLAVVTNPGARGKVEALAESFRNPAGGKPEEEGIEMTEDDIKAIAAPILAAIESLAEALTPTEDDTTKEPSISTVAEAVASAGLTEQGRQAVYALIEAGVAVEAAVEVEVEREKAIRESLKAEAEESGRLQESGIDFEAQFNQFIGG